MQYLKFIMKIQLSNFLLNLISPVEFSPHSNYLRSLEEELLLSFQELTIKELDNISLETRQIFITLKMKRIC